MPLPLIPLALAGTTLAGGFLAGDAMASKKSENTSVFPDSSPFSVNAQTYSPETHAAYEQYSKAIQYAPVTSIQYPDYAININSPEATATTKKETTVTSKPSQTYDATQSSNSGNSSGTNLVTIALIAGAALVAYGLVSK